MDHLTEPSPYVLGSWPMPRNKAGTVQARIHKLEHDRLTLAVMRASNESILRCAYLSRDIDRQEAELKLEVAKEAALTPEQRAEREARRQARIDTYQAMLAKNRKPREGGDA